MRLNDLRDDSKPRKNKNVYFRMSKEPEEMLKEDWITSSRWIKEGCIEVTIC